MKRLSPENIRILQVKDDEWGRQRDSSDKYKKVFLRKKKLKTKIKWIKNFIQCFLFMKMETVKSFCIIDHNFKDQ